MFVFDRYVPLLDPDTFFELPFYQELEALGYRQVLLGGTGSGKLPEVARQIRSHTKLKVILYPAGPDSSTSTRS